MKEYIRCPRCGQQNPAFRKSCEWCGARLPHQGDEGMPPVPEEEQELDALVEPEENAFDTSTLLEDEDLRRWLNEVLGEEGEEGPLTEEVEEARAGTVEEEQGEKAPSVVEEEPVLPPEEPLSLAGEVEVPEWVHEAMQEEGPEEEETFFPEKEGAPQEPLLEAEFPEWLREEAGVQEPVGEAEGEVDLVEEGAIRRETFPFPGEGEEEEIPPWLQEEDASPAPEAVEAFSGVDESELSMEEAEPESGAPEEVPEGLTWLSELAEEAPGEEEPLSWLLESEETEGEVPEQEAFPMAEAPEEEVVSAPEEEVPVPSVFEEQEEQREETEPQPEPSAVSEAPREGETEAGPIFGEVILDDQELASLLDEAARAEAASEEEGVEDLAPGELPAWLSALQPQVQEAEGEETVPETDLVGPLAGIPDVLPVESRLTEMVRGEVRPVLKLLVRKEEQQWARWLQHWIQREEAAGTERMDVERPMPYWLWRVTVGFLLVLLLLGLLIFGPKGTVSSPAPSRGAQAFVAMVQGLPERSVVLLAVDYNPAWAREVHWSARTALRLLESKEPHYLVVTTQPYGLALAETLLQANGIPPERYTVLGYLPGDRIALAVLARWPKAAFPPPVQGENPWAHPALQQWTGLASTALVLVLTDQGTRARDWIEQLTPYLPSHTALAFAGSLQIVPVLEPYFDTQVRGWIGGLPDAAALTSQTQLEVPLDLWTAWSVSWSLGLFLTVLSAATLAVVYRIRQREAP